MSKWSSAFRDSRWQKLRLEVMERDEWKCQSCGASGDGVTLNVHHAFYESGKAPWEYPPETLFTWCEKCHKYRHAWQKKLLLAFSKTRHGDVADICRAVEETPETVGLLSLVCGCGTPIDSIESCILALNACARANQEDQEGPE